MLTFHFTGAGGRMTEYELLTAGMTGKQIRFLFSPEWDGLKKVAVYRAGDISCVQEDIQELDTIPSRVLSKSLRRLYVGVYGVSEDGRVAIPTVLVPGPFIHIGASAEESVPDPDSPNWTELEQALAETVRFTPQILTEAQQAQARANIGASEGGLSAAAAALLLRILKKAVYTEDVAQSILELEEALSTTETPEEPEIVYYCVSCELENVIAQPASATVAQGQGCTVTLTAEEGYLMESVTVTMGGSDITASVYADGSVTIGAVTGNVVIRAKAAEQVVEPEITEVPITLSLTKTSVSNNQRTIALGERYVTSFVPAEGYFVDKVTVTMGGTDVTAQVYANNLISIPEVTGAIMVIAVAAAEPGPVTVTEIVKGTTTFASGEGFYVIRTAEQTARATLYPSGQYLRKGTTYRFSLGSAAADYWYGVQIMAVPNAGLTFPCSDGQQVCFNTVLDRTVDTGWMQADYTYTPEANNMIFSMNFKRTSGNFEEAHYAELLANVVVEEVTA